MSIPVVAIYVIEGYDIRSVVAGLDTTSPRLLERTIPGTRGPCDGLRLCPWGHRMRRL
jgi:hypothetical protein